MATPKEVANETKRDINPRKAPGFYLINGEILKQYPRKGLVKLTNLINVHASTLEDCQSEYGP
jgi:hypothetical protein